MRMIIIGLICIATSGCALGSLPYEINRRAPKEETEAVAPKPTVDASKLVPGISVEEVHHIVGRPTSMDYKDGFLHEYNFIESTPIVLLYSKENILVEWHKNAEEIARIEKAKSAMAEKSNQLVFDAVLCGPWSSVQLADRLLNNVFMSSSEPLKTLVSTL